MPRAIWSGAISFGLVTIPVKLFNSVSKKSVRFNQLDSRTGSRIKRKWVSAADGDEVPSDVLVRGYEVSSGNYVTISDEELDSLDPPASRAIDIIEFVDASEIDPTIYDNAYHLVPDELAAKAYRVLTDALEDSNKVAIAKMVMRTKQYVVAVRPATESNSLMLSTLVYADEVNAATDIEGMEHVEGIEVREAEVDMAMSLITSLSAEFEHGKYEDEHRLRIMDLVARKAEGEEITIEAPVASDDGKVVDLMAALEASVAAAKEARGRHPSASTDEEADDSVEEAEEVEAEAKPAKPTRKKAKKAKTKTTAKKAAAKKKATAKRATKKTAIKKSA